MALPEVRPTIRCLLEELKDDLTDANQRSALASGKLSALGKEPRLSSIAHPLMAKALMLLELDESTLRAHHVSAVRDRAWYRVKSGQYRGAVWIDASGNNVVAT
jgi:hypothetical protein